LVVILSTQTAWRGFTADRSLPLRVLSWLGLGYFRAGTYLSEYKVLWSHATACGTRR